MQVSIVQERVEPGIDDSVRDCLTLDFSRSSDVAIQHILRTDLAGQGHYESQEISYIKAAY